MNYKAVRIKIIFIFAILILTSKFSYSQNYLQKTYEEVWIAFIFYDYSFKESTYIPYQPDWDFQYSVMATAQARYDYYFDIIHIEYQKLKSLKLVNIQNTNLLDEHLNDVTTVGKKWKDIDLGVTSTGVENSNKIIKYITWIYAVPSIVSEIKLLKSCNTELKRIRNSNPDGFLYTKRYKAIQKTLYELEHCPSTQISQLSWERTELNMTENSTSDLDKSSGCIYGNCQDGYGVYIWDNGDKYAGEWVNWQRHGKGTYLFNNGDKYAGDWVNNKRSESTGMYKWASGEFKKY